VPLPFTKAQRGLGIATAHFSDRAGLYSGCVVAEQVALGAKCPVVLLLLMEFSVASIQLQEVLGHEYAGHCHNMQVMMHDMDLGIASFMGSRFVICR
jgi:hypothetical protein